MTDDNNGWPSRPGVPLHPERDAFHWLLRVGAAWNEAWRWDPDADGCGTEYSGAWAEGDGDGQPADMARWFSYAGPCLTPAEHAAALADARAQGRREALEEAARECEAAQDDRERDAALEARRSAYNQYPYAEMGEEAGRLAAAIRALAQREGGA